MIINQRFLLIKKIHHKALFIELMICDTLVGVMIKYSSITVTPSSTTFVSPYYNNNKRAGGRLVNN